VVEAFDGLTKRALAEEFENFVSVAEVVFEDNLVITLVVIIAMVEDVHLL
jgi:hypothetical protein